MSSSATLPLVVLTLDTSLSVRSVNPIFLGLLGYQDRELIGHSFEKLIVSHPADVPLARLLGAADEPDGVELKLRFICARGGSLAASVNVVKLTDVEPQKAGWLDITLNSLDHDSVLQQALRIDDALALARIASWELDIATGRIFASHSWHELWGFTAAEETRLAAALERVHPQERKLVESALSNAAESGACFHIRFRILRPDGTLRWVEEAGRASSPGSARLCGAVLDISDQREAEHRLLQAAAVYAATSEGVLITNASGIIVAVNTALTRISGYTESELLGHKPSLLSSHWHTRGFFVGMWRRLLRRGSWQGEVWNRHKDGEVYRQRLTIQRVLDSRGTLVSFVGVFAEGASTRQVSHQHTEHLLHYDALTKLPNRLLFESRLEHALALVSRTTDPIALLLLDLDHFAHINTSLGYEIGDDLLRAIALRLREAIRPADTLARLRADQFALLIEELHHVDEAPEIARRLCERLRVPIWVRGHLLHINMSIGIALRTRPDDDQSSLFNAAESALRQVKRQGRNNAFLISADKPHAAQQAQQHLIGLLHTALENDGFKLLYRPGVAMTTGVCDYVEASIHCTYPEFRLMPPERLCTLANESDLLAKIGHWVLRNTCGQLQTWLSTGVTIPSQGVRICERLLTDGDLLRRLAQLLEEHPLVAPHLVLEFGEPLLLKHHQQIAEVFQGIHRLGVGIALYGVGSGWIAPAVLQRLPIKSLKMHPSFIVGLPDAPHELAVVEVLIAMAQSLHLEIRADGVRTKNQQYQLMSLGCFLAQGELFSGPLNAAQLEAWIQSKQRNTAPPPQRTS